VNTALEGVVVLARRQVATPDGAPEFFKRDGPASVAGQMGQQLKLKRGQVNRLMVETHLPPPWAGYYGLMTKPVNVTGAVL
jgi:hypothetical protein